MEKSMLLLSESLILKKANFEIFDWLKIWECVILGSQGDEDLALGLHYHALSPLQTLHCEGTNTALTTMVLALTIWCPHLFCDVCYCCALHSLSVLCPQNFARGH